MKTVLQLMGALLVASPFITVPRIPTASASALDPPPRRQPLDGNGNPLQCTNVFCV